MLAEARVRHQSAVGRNPSHPQKKKTRVVNVGTINRAPVGSAPLEVRGKQTRSSLECGTSGTSGKQKQQTDGDEGQSPISQSAPNRRMQATMAKQDTVSDSDQSHVSTVARIFPLDQCVLRGPGTVRQRIERASLRCLLVASIRREHPPHQHGQQNKTSLRSPRRKYEPTLRPVETSNRGRHGERTADQPANHTRKSARRDTY